MSYPWNKIKEIVEKIEYDKVVNELSSLEYRDGFIQRRPTLTDKTKGYLDFLGGLAVGVCIGVFTLMFNYLLFVWLIHIEVNPQTASTLEKKLKKPAVTSGHSMAEYNSLGTSGHFDDENSEESKHALEYLAQYIEQSAKWISKELKTCAVNFVKGLHSVIDRLRESVGLYALQTAKVGADVKETGAIAPDRRLIILTSKEEIKKEVDGFQRQNDTSGTVYTVQVGAFKDYHRADALKRKLIKKGYDAYVSFTGLESDISIFKLCKVWIGEFTHREKAERASTEIGETEGLRAFVTLK